MTTFNLGDKVLLPEWLGGGEAVVYEGGSGQVGISVNTNWIRLHAEHLTKAPTPEPTGIGSIYTDKEDKSYVLVDSGNRGWRWVGERQYTWEEISN